MMLPRQYKQAYGFMNNHRFTKTLAAIAKVGAGCMPSCVCLRVSDLTLLLKHCIHNVFDHAGCIAEFLLSY